MLWFYARLIRDSNAKTAKKSANVTPASPMNTWTAERTFARNNIIFHQRKTCFSLMDMKPVFI